MTVNSRAYKIRLLQVLITTDIAILKVKFGITDLDLIDARFWLADNWNDEIKDEVLTMIIDRLNKE